MHNVHKILLITTGGTISGVGGIDIGGREIANVEGGFVKILDPSVKFLNEKHNLKILIKTEEVCNCDSSDILPSNWIDLSNLIKKRYDDFDAFVITHGTNTLGYTCAALSFSLVNLNKPVILTASQVPAGFPGSDAFLNLNNALSLAVWRHNGQLVRGVLAVFGSHIITGTRVKKDTEFDYDAFKSFRSGSVGRIGRVIDIDESNLEKHLKYLESKKFPPATRADDLICQNDFDMNIASLTEFPGMAPEIFKALVEHGDVKGIILRAFGAGDATTHLHHIFEYLKDRQIPIVVTTQAPNGNSSLQVNKPGIALLRKKLAIPAFDMSIESQTIKLAWLLGKMRNGEIDYQQLCDQMAENIRGEINPKYDWDIINS